MPIQFRCPNCQQPLEVDDQYALQTAQCCYCGKPAPVPAASSLSSPTEIVARPVEYTRTGLPQLPTSNADVVPSIPPTPTRIFESTLAAARASAAASYGNYALVCTSVMLLLVMGLVVFGVSQMLSRMQPGATSQPSMQEFQQLVASSPYSSYFVGASCAAAFFALAGFSLGVASILHFRASWRGWLALGLCGSFLLCNCASAALRGLAP